MSDRNVTARSSAVRLHEDAAPKFVEEYRKGRQGDDSAFLYGRRCIAPHFDRVVGSLPEGARILDVGCGTGEQLAALHDRGHPVIGVEPARNMREIARRRVPADLVHDASVLDLPFDDGSFDFVYSLEVLRYLSSGDNLRALGEIRRILRPGGVFLGTFVNLLALDGFALLVYLRRMRARFGRPLRCHTEFETPGGLERKFSSIGFESWETHGAGFAPVRVAWKILPAGLAAKVGRMVEPYDTRLCQPRLLRPLAGHLIGIARA